MSLEHSKQYDRQLKPRDFGDKSAERINKATPHQAPQRERVSISTHVRRPSSAAARAGSRRSPGKQRGWRDHISSSVNMGVPTLMMILEPNVVWGHSHVRSSSNSRGAEAAACQGYFFDGLDQQSKLSHGVYEGSYWQLLGDLSELEDMLSRMTRAPALLQEPVLELPPQPELPKWDQFKPELLTLPDAPSAAADPVLPQFVEPDLPESVELSPPQLDPVPLLPAPWKEVSAPEFIPPPAPKVEPMRVPELVLPPAPVHKEPAKPAGSGPPQCGHDWSGNRPFTVPVPTYSPPSLPPEPVEIPEQLPQPELLEAQLQLQPEPLAVLGWAGGPEDPDDDATVPVLGSAEGATATAGVTDSGTTGTGGSLVGSAKASTAGIQAVWQEIQAVQQQVKTLATEELHDAWKEVQSLAPAISGAPAIWLDFKAPFAELPPVLLPPKPEAGPEPQYEPPGELLDLPAYKPPVPQPMPDYVEPPVILPTWASPCEPLPVGFLRGTAPVLIMDVSGTMHPARRGQFVRVKKCVCELLEPDGELATAGSAFDVLAFSGSCWSWSAAHAGKQALIASAMQASNTGRQAGGRQSGQLAQHTSSLARTRTQWQRQQVQQRWQQQQQQHRPGTAASGSRAAERLESSAAAEGAEYGESVEDHWQQRQQELAVATTPRVAAGTRPGSAVAAAAGHTRLTIAEAAGSSSPRSLRPMTADSAVRHSAEPLMTSPRQQQQPQQQFGPMLQPADADHLQEARSWVQNWPAAVGNTNLLTALNTAHQYTFTNSSSRSPRFGSGTAAAEGVVGPYVECSSDSVDCYYLFSDGLADDAAACLQWVQQQAEAGTPVRPIHTVGFFPRNGSPAGDRFLSQLATATGGTFQVYNADLPVPAAAAAILRKIKDSSKPAAGTEAAADAAEPAAAGVPKVWESSLGAFVAVDLQNEDAATRAERRWAEQQLKQRRMDNRRRGRIEPLHVMLEALRQQHQQQRVMAAMEQHQQKLLQLKAAHTAACAAVTKANEAAVRQAQREHAVAVQQVQEENKRRVSAAHQAHAAAVQEWKQQYQKALSAWQQAVDEAQAIAAVAAAAAETQARGIVSEDAANTANSTAHGSKTDAEALQADQHGLDPIPATSSTKDVNSGLAAAAAADSFVIQQPQQQPSSESSSGILLGPDLSLAPQEDACSAGLDVTGSESAAAAGGANGSTEVSIEQLQPQVVGTAVSNDVIEGNSNSSAKLTLPLPASRETHSTQNTARSLSSWGGTPRLPDTAAAAAAAGGGSSQQLQRPGTAASRPVSAAVAQSNSAARGLGTKISIAAGAAAPGSGASMLASSSNAPAAAAALGSKPKANSRPKSAAARLSADSGGSSAGNVVNANKQKQKGSNSSKGSSSGSKRPSSGVSLSEPGRLSAATAAAAAAVLGNAVDASGGEDCTAEVDSLGDLVEAADCSSSPPGSRQMRRSYTSVHQRDLDSQQQQQQQQVMTQEEQVLNHIQSINVANRAALEQIYSEWHTQVVEAEQYNSSALQLHNHESKIHAARHAAYLTQHEAWEAGVQQLQRHTQQEHEVAAARAVAENARLAKLHEQEVAEKVAKEAAYAQFISEHAAAHTAAVKQHEAAVAAAKATHEAAVAAAREVWQQQQAESEQQYQQQLAAAMQQHTERVQQVKEQNRLTREAHKEASEAYRAATLGNKRKLALYEEQQREAAEQLAAANAGALQQARQDYKVLCAQLLELHTQQQATAQAEWLASKAAVQQRNDEAIAEARARYAAAVDELLQEHQAVCDQLKQQHEAELTRIRSRNEELMPQALVAQLATIELGRVRAFATHMRACAAKLQLGVNFLTETPNLDRVVEMSALTDALRAAFPDVEEPRDYPWPLEELSTQPQPEQQHQQQLESVPAHQQEPWISSNNRGLAAPASPMPAGPGSLAALGWGRTIPRPNTAPAAVARADPRSPRSTGSLHSKLQSSSKAGWCVKAPGVVDYKAALQDPAVWLKQLQRPHSSNTCRHKSHSRASSSHSITGTRRKHMLPGHRGSSPVQAAPAGLQYVMSLQRPQTAPTAGQTIHAQTAAGSSLHNCNHTHEDVNKWTLQEDNGSGSGTACRHGMQRPAVLSTASLGSMSVGGRGAIGVPARHAVEHSRAGQRMAQVLVLHGQRQSGFE